MVIMKDNFTIFYTTGVAIKLSENKCAPMHIGRTCSLLLA